MQSKSEWHDEQSFRIPVFVFDFTDRVHEMRFQYALRPALAAG
jgi:hypothetical protein